MTYNYPFFSFPHFRRYPNYYQAQYPYVNENNYSKKENISNTRYHQLTKENGFEQKASQKEKSSSKRTSSGFSFLNNFLRQEDRGEDEEFFELLGLKLYNDDLLLIGLIFFLYKEDVKDQYLFFALILLLLS